MNTFYGDLETFCETPIQHGSYRYAEGAEIMLWSWALNDGEISVVDFTDPEHDTFELDRALEAADEVVFQNSMFDRTVLRAKMPESCPPLIKWRDTRVQALAHSIPGGLEKQCQILDTPRDIAKQAEGKKWIQLFCKPRPKNSKIRRATRETHPKEWAAFKDYAGHDISSMRYNHRKLPRWNYPNHSLALWHLDQRINDRGILIDMDMVNAAVRVIEREKKRLAKHTKALTDDEVASTTQRNKLLRHLLKEYGVELPDLRSSTVEKFLDPDQSDRRMDDEEIPWQVKALLANRLEATRASLAKYKALQRSVCSDGRVRGTLQFCGALRTGRWAGKIFQPHNLMRTPKSLVGEDADRNIETARAAIREEWVDLVYEKPMEVLSAGVPWVMTAPPGKKIVVSDLRNIESRVLAWYADEEWKLEMFRRYDEDPDDLARDPYIVGYATSFGVHIDEVIKDYEEGGIWRQLGKVMELALGYQGAVGAFIAMALAYKIDLQDLVKALDALPKHAYDAAAKAWRWAEREKKTYDLDRKVYMACWALTMIWRDANTNIVQFWRDLQAAVKTAIMQPGVLYTVGKLRIRRQGEWLGIKLPSGHTLCYPQPRLVKGKITYKGQNQYTRKWSTISTYGGKVAENATQASATGEGGVLGAAMPSIEAAGFEIVTHTHDEIAAEAPDTDKYSHKRLGELLTADREWTYGLPLSAGGYESQFYRKD
jgi:DNA polymerase